MPNSKYEYLAQELLEVQQTLGWMDLVLSSINDAVCVIDANGKLIFTNEYFAHLLGEARVFLLGKNMKDVIDLKKIDVPLAEYRENQTKLSVIGTGEEGIYEWKNKQDQILKFKVASRLLPNSDQTVYLIQNITSEYELTGMKNSFINLASHQLRTPMTAIRTYSHILSDGMAGKLTKEQQLITDTIIHSTERMNSLINGLLKITRVQSDQANFVTETINLNTVFKKIRMELYPRVFKKKLKCTIKIPKNLAPIQNDTSAINEIFSNLIVNAIQYTREGGEINVTAKQLKDKVVLSVTDTGIGIPKDQLHLLFAQFTRAENAQEEFAEGSGLGLYLVKVLLDKIGGTIKVSSKLGSGTTFKVYLPTVPPTTPG